MGQKITIIGNIKAQYGFPLYMYQLVKFVNIQDLFQSFFCTHQNTNYMALFKR